VTWRKGKKEQKGRPVLPVIAVAVVALGVGAYFYLGMSHGPPVPLSNIMTCEVGSYGVFSAVTVSNGHSSTENFTETTGTNYTTTNSVAGPVGSVSATGTNFGATSGFVSYGDATVCTYLATSTVTVTSSPTSSSSTSATSSTSASSSHQ